MILRPLRLAIFALACLAVIWGSLVPSVAPQAVSMGDKLQHASAYLLLTVLGGAALPRRLTWLVVGLFAGGVMIELLQTLMGLGRQGDPADALANTMGIILGLGVILAVRALTAPGSRASGE